MAKATKIMSDEWWCNGRIIVKQDKPYLPKFISFDDSSETGFYIQTHDSFKQAKQYCDKNPCFKPDHQAIDYLK